MGWANTGLLDPSPHVSILVSIAVPRSTGAGSDMTGERLQPQRLLHRRIVVKVGSNVLTGGEEGGLHTPTIAAIATQVAGLVHRGAQVALVTSGRM